MENTSKKTKVYYYEPIYERDISYDNKRKTELMYDLWLKYRDSDNYEKIEVTPYTMSYKFTSVAFEKFIKKYADDSSILIIPNLSTINTNSKKAYHRLFYCRNKFKEIYVLEFGVKHSISYYEKRCTNFFKDNDRRSKRPPERIEQYEEALDYLITHDTMPRNQALKEVGRLYNVSRSGLNKYCASEYWCTLGEYLNKPEFRI